MYKFTQLWTPSFDKEDKNAELKNMVSSTNGTGLTGFLHIE